MKNEKGITMIVLIITAAIMTILATAIVYTGNDSIQGVKLKNFNYELQQVQGKVDTIYEKIQLGQDEYKVLGSNITESNKAMQTLITTKGIDYQNIAEENRDKYYYNATTTKYRYLNGNEAKEKLDISSSPGDLIINFETREVISVDGYEYKGKTIYTAESMNS